MNSPLDFQDWIGREEVTNEQISQDVVARMAATLDVPSPHPGDNLPPGWQWLFFNPVVAAGHLASDGHPARDLGAGILPPVPLERRMWAGSRVEYVAELPVGAMATRRSQLINVTFKEGRSGRMCFVTVAHETAVDGRVVIREEQDIVYKASSPPGPASANPSEPAPVLNIPTADHQSVHHPGSVLLFRYSALTFNGHRIHYDLPYANDVEGYPGLVVHGPLTATLLQGFAQMCADGMTLRKFDFKATHPVFAGDELHLRAWRDGNSLSLKAFNGKGALAMQASAQVEGQ